MDAVTILAAQPPRLRARHIAAVVAGNALEYYDFLTYAFFAAEIGRTFFPSDRPGSSLLASLATFGAGFLTRPLGAVVLGRMGDRVGRKPALLLSFALIGVAIVGLALTPSYARIGVAAPVLAIGFRMLQGFALGGEIGPSAAFLVEAAPPARRGFYSSWLYMGADGAILFAGLVGLGLTAAMGQTGLDAWGWRIAFLIGAAILPIGLMLRRALPETLHASNGEARGPHPDPRGFRRAVVLGFVLMATATSAGYVLTYLNTYAGETLHLPAAVGFGATVAVGVAGLLANPLGGWLSDRFGRRPVMLAPWLFLVAAVLPGFRLIAAHRTPSMLYAVAAVLYAAQSLSGVAGIVAITEALPRARRSGALAITYALAIALFGGGAHFIIAWLIQTTGNPLAPAWYLLAAGIPGAAAMWLMPETAPIKRGTTPPRAARPEAVPHPS